MSQLVYVYAILRQPVAASVDGIDGRPLRWIGNDQLVAAVSDVPARDFSEEPLNERIRDITWLGPRAIAHQDVNEHLWEASTATVPLAFGTVFRDDERVQGLLSTEAIKLLDRLQQVEDRGEWVVALHRVNPLSPAELAAHSPTLQQLHAQIETSSPGRAHLLRRQAATLERDEAHRRDAEAARALSDMLRPAADDVFAEALPGDAVERPLARLSVLVKRKNESAFLDVVDGARRRWPEPTYRLLLTGPWPAYRFGGLARD
ncbi:MAG: GvpL/GvpF family gas vesicle protein [Chloroflexi bacterium]|nr:GvpL/GvpF family gas vesicle protein [Chloroflexota bacterium]